MRLPRVQFTIRRMMLTVLVVASALACGREIPAVLRQREEYHRRARMWAWYEEQERGFIRDVPYTLKGLGNSPNDRAYRLVLEARLQHAQRRLPYFLTLRRKYELAALMPWSSVPPDPPEPE